jgi:hypothetical protein
LDVYRSLLASFPIQQFIPSRVAWFKDFRLTIWLDIV